MSNWTYEQDLAVLHLKVTRIRQTDPAILRLAEAMGRSEASVWMRKCNFDALDPNTPSGLSHYGKLTARIWGEYATDPARLRRMARRAFVSLTQGSAHGQAAP